MKYIRSKAVATALTVPLLLSGCETSEVGGKGAGIEESTQDYEQLVADSTESVQYATTQEEAQQALDLIGEAHGINIILDDGEDYEFLSDYIRQSPLEDRVIQGKGYQMVAMFINEISDIEPGALDDLPIKNIFVTSALTSEDGAEINGFTHFGGYYEHSTQTIAVSMRAEALFHEIAHALHYTEVSRGVGQVCLDLPDEFREIHRDAGFEYKQRAKSGGEQIDIDNESDNFDFETVGTPEQVSASDYGFTNPAEDVAEAFEHIWTHRNNEDTAIHEDSPFMRKVERALRCLEFASPELREQILYKDQ